MVYVKKKKTGLRWIDNEQVFEQVGACSGGDTRASWLEGWEVIWEYDWNTVKRNTALKIVYIFHLLGTVTLEFPKPGSQSSDTSICW